MGIMGCSDETSNALLDLRLPVSVRMTGAEVTGAFKVDIRVDSGLPQSFTFNNDESSFQVNLSGIEPDELHTIDILWFEILNGFEIEISEQSQVFTANANAVIDAPHNHLQFDYDADGSSNLDERAGGTCVWSAQEACLNSSEGDIPTDNLLFNGDFSNETEYWWASHRVVNPVEGEFCAFSPATAINRANANLGYRDTLFLPGNNRYILSFDVRAETASATNAALNISQQNENPFVVITQDFDVSTFYERKTMILEPTNESLMEVHLVFNYGNGMNNTYCFDNIVLRRESP